ncbi:tyrosine-type recombinase/integrase [Kordiimonas marina]|uniref:tyrosine-type recombinase/integrase n=1 Tax=Kordiimonas marina TaxID=2872312 RepID=UPI001FF11C40|nr:tyrosine-type recombinase/integrase [Kordiimonas marina]MCJ9428060.1 site-specific integrase [Kordiimonas marina]
MLSRLNRKVVDQLAPAAKPYEVRDTQVKGLIVRVQPSGTKSYYCEFRRGRRISLGKACHLSVEEARTAAITAISEARNGEDPAAARKRRKAVSSFKEYLDAHYGPWLIENTSSGEATIKRLKTTFAFLLAHKLDDILLSDLEKWRTKRLAGGVKHTTVNRDISAVKAALNRAVEWKLIETNPLQALKKSREDKIGRVRFLNEQERKRLFEALEAREERMRSERDTANHWRRERGYDLLPDLRQVTFADHLKPMILLSLNTGLRRGELFSLRRTDIDLKNKLLTVRGTNAKSKRTRHVPLNAVALAVMTDWRKQSAAGAELIFVGKGGGMFDNVSSSWERLLDEADIMAFRWHDMRHDFASQLAMAGVDLNTIRELLGHSDYSMTLRYAHLAPNKMADAVARIG